MKKIRIVASTNPGYQAPKEELDKMAGLMAGVCYLPDTTQSLFNESEEKTQRRLSQILAGGHHSPFDHESFTLEFVGIPKIVAMILNNEKMYTTSEKSARYKTMELPAEEQKYYDKWVKIFQDRISKKYKDKSPYFTDLRITKLAQENARYMTSVFTPTTMEYTVTYRQFNVLYSLIAKNIDEMESSIDPFYCRLRESLKELKMRMEELPYLNEQLFDTKDRHLSLIDRNPTRPIIKQYGDVYKISYLGSFAQLAQAQRHRTLQYTCRIPQAKSYYLPPILKNDHSLVVEWHKDIQNLEHIFPQGTLVEIIEEGNLENLILKAKERKCTCAQLEIERQTTASIDEIYKQLKKSNHPGAKDLEPYDTKASRCTFGYKCTSPCGFKDGIKGDRII